MLKYFAEQTGGQAFFPFKAQDLAQSFENIANELRHQYNVLYRPEPLKADGLYHPVDVKVRGSQRPDCARAARILRSADAVRYRNAARAFLTFAPSNATIDACAFWCVTIRSMSSKPSACC